MRKKRNQQLPLVEATADHPKAKELARMDEILNANSIILELAIQDLGLPENKSGANGITAEQVVRAALIKQVEGFSYRELSFHLVDSRAYSQFCRIGIGKSFRKSALHAGIKALTWKTWEQINLALVEYAGQQSIEKGRKVRVDCTVVESNIHTPYDSELLFDSVRVLSRALSMGKQELPGIVFTFHDHCRRSKRRNLGIMNAKNAAERKKAYADLIAMAERTIGYGEKALQALPTYRPATLAGYGAMRVLKQELNHYLPLARQVVCQTRRRVILGESVPAQDKIVSIFEPHTDIIRKDRRDTYYGHKICITGGASNLILDCVVLDGNPADSELAVMMLERQKEIYNRPPLKASFDGGFASRENLIKAKSAGVKDVCFAKGRGLNEEEMCRSGRVFKGLRNFRAGIESGISWLKRSFGLTRCMFKGVESFKSYVWSSIVAANLLTIARKQLAS